MKLTLKIIDKIPEGFGTREEYGKISIFNKDWEEEIMLLARKEIRPGGKDLPDIEYLRGRGRPVVVPFPRGNLVVRHYYHGGCFRGLTGDIFRGVSRFLNELRVLAEAYQSGLPVPEPAGLIISPAGAGFFRAELISVYIPDTRDLLTYYQQFPINHSREDDLKKRGIIQGAGRVVSALHQTGFLHADLQLKNIIVQSTPSGPRIFILDFDKARRDKSPGNNMVRENLLRLYRSFSKMRISHQHISEYDPIRFLRSYAPDNKELRKNIIRQVLKSRLRKKFRLLKWKITLRLRGSSYSRPMRDAVNIR